MKTIVPLRIPFIALLIPATIMTLLCASGPLQARLSGRQARDTKVSVNSLPTGQAGPRDTILVNKSNISRKHKIRLYPNADHRVLFFSATGEQGRVYQLYLFDMDGKLSKQIQIRNKETTVLTNIVKGDYLFEVFSDDERIENGHVSIR
jgi:hypothetical protein